MAGSAYDFLAPSKKADPYAGIDFSGGKSAFSTLPANAPNMSPIGSLATGGSGSTVAGADGGNWWDNNAGTVGQLTSLASPLIASLFSSDNPYPGLIKDNTDTLAKNAAGLDKFGKGLTAQGQDALHPVMQYLLALTGADPAALAQATQPERAKVLDQYDTARKALQFIPRGGGQASATMDAGAKAASDISTLTANARNKGTEVLGNLATQLMSQGITSQADAANMLSTAITHYEKLGQDEKERQGAFGKIFGKLLTVGLNFIPGVGPALAAGAAAAGA